MKDRIVVDVEIQKTIEELPRGWDSTDLMGVSVACVWEYQGQRMRVYGPDDVQALRERILAADEVAGFNIFNFDFPVIWGVSRSDWALSSHLKEMLLPTTNDILRRIWLSLRLDPDRYDKKTHSGYSLDRIVELLFGKKKIGYGGDAPKWYQAGQWAKLANYCADDVALERDLLDFIDRYGFIIDPHTGKMLPIDAESGR